MLVSCAVPLPNFERAFVMFLPTILTILLSLAATRAVDNPSELLEPRHPSEGIYREPRIVYGIDANPKQFPWMASIYARHTNSYKLCGGSLISNRHVLTAAHCVAGVISASIGLGTTNMQEPRVSVVATSYIRHENYSSSTLNNDLAIYFLPVTIVFDEFIKPIRLPTLGQASSSFEKATGIVSGFGRYSVVYSTTSQFLKYVYARVISNRDCEQNYGGNVIIGSVMCALGYETDEQGTCHGDSGGPLVVQEGTQFTQIGVVSFISSSGCGTGRPYGFTRTANHLAWISEKTGLTIRLR